MDTTPSTPSAHRVRVDSSPLSSSPLRFLSSMLAGENAEARSHPDATRDVWELAVWDPATIALQMFCLFSPGHVMVYWLFLPTAVSDPRLNTTVVTTITLAAVVSLQLFLLQKSFSRQSKDTAIIQKEVMNEYDTKYVHPRTQPLMRDVGTQISQRKTSALGWPQHENASDSVDVYAPTFIINRGFQTYPNPNYNMHLNHRSSANRPTPSGNSSLSIAASVQTPTHLRDVSSPIPPQTQIRQPHFRASKGGDGGNFGIYSHAHSPLRKSASTNFSGFQGLYERGSSPPKRESSPLKRSSLAQMTNQQHWVSSQGISSRRENGRL